MVLIAKQGFTEEELARLNKVRLHQQTIFLACVLGASGKMLDRKYPEKRQDHEKCPTVKFLVEKPPREDFDLWRAALRSVVPMGDIQDKLGKWLHSGCRIWDRR